MYNIIKPLPSLSTIKSLDKIKKSKKYANIIFSQSTNKFNSKSKIKIIPND